RLGRRVRRRLPRAAGVRRTRPAPRDRAARRRRRGSRRSRVPARPAAGDRRRCAARTARRARRRRPPGTGRGTRAGLPHHPRARPGGGGMTRYDDGMAVRREVLGDAHVDRASAATTDLTRDFQELITEYAWGSVWTRPGLDRRTRSLLTITALVARGHHDELALNIRGPLRNGVSVAEIEETLLHCAVYCGVPAANTAFRVAQDTLDQLEGHGCHRHQQRTRGAPHGHLRNRLARQALRWRRVARRGR